MKSRILPYLDRQLTLEYLDMISALLPESRNKDNFKRYFKKTWINNSFNYNDEVAHIRKTNNGAESYFRGLIGTGISTKQRHGEFISDLINYDKRLIQLYDDVRDVPNHSWPAFQTITNEEHVAFVEATMRDIRQRFMSLENNGNVMLNADLEALDDEAIDEQDVYEDEEEYEYEVAFDD